MRAEDRGVLASSLLWAVHASGDKKARDTFEGDVFDSVPFAFALASPDWIQWGSLWERIQVSPAQNSRSDVRRPRFPFGQVGIRFSIGGKVSLSLGMRYMKRTRLDAQCKQFCQRKEKHERKGRPSSSDNFQERGLLKGEKTLDTLKK
jgi:hypothetical protein